MATATLLKPNTLKWVQPLSTRFPTRNLVLRNLNLTFNHGLRSSSGTLAVKCSVSTKGFSCLTPILLSRPRNSLVDIQEKPKRTPFEVLVVAISKTLECLKIPVTAGFLIALFLCTTSHPKSLLAASAGRVGGRSFSSSRSRSRSRSSVLLRRYASKLSSSCSCTCCSSISEKLTKKPSHKPTRKPYSDKTIMLWIFTFAVSVVIFFFLYIDETMDEVDETTVLKLQVGLLGAARNLQKDLNQIAETADTSSSKGLNSVLTEAMQALLRHPDFWVYAYSSADIKSGTENVKRAFEQHCEEERKKLSEETLVNVNGIKKRSITNENANSFCSEYIVVTILVAAEGKYKLPTIKDKGRLREALTRLRSITSNRTQALELLWTPQKDDDMLSEEQLRKDYPLLRPLPEMVS